MAAKGERDPSFSRDSGKDADGVDKEAMGNLGKQTSIFHWEDLCYDIKIKGEPRKLLDHVDGWVEPGTLTALMGASGAGKTTLLDTLARDYAETWRESTEYQEVKNELARKRELVKTRPAVDPQMRKKSPEYSEFAARFWTQFRLCFYRVCQQYWKTPSYIYAKIALSSLTVRFSFGIFGMLVGC
ncbi:hypothetical protein K435DRAFT_765907 [Dendrothele bispora CBS 962.96]|uniref:ABC transporter domain-containing protein n=1 Tax=Dendrothele bispora (strain CBS 962.96) TaxID=1314807 RepID=A0A4S8L495_DENBC|nr:hypothetical protein K435DRAFT_765907 [Dendrothele bispora CBS 962.96]